VTGLLNALYYFAKKNTKGTLIFTAQFLSGSAATRLRWGGRFYSRNVPGRFWL